MSETIIPDASQIRQIQHLQLEMMKHVDEICRRNHIPYTLIGGSLLGAVRHQGFIPWDDDLDIGLKRQDYEKLIRLLEKDPGKNCFLQTMETDPAYPLGYAKLRLNDTELRETFWRKSNMHQGVFIDIFPLDAVNHPGSAQTKARRALTRLITFAIWRRHKVILPRSGAGKIEPAVSAVINLLSESALKKIQKRLIEREGKGWSYYASMLDGNYSPSQFYLENKDFDNLIDVPFEDASFSIPKNSPEILIRLYGNYMEMPPEEKRSSGHEFVKIVLPKTGNKQ